MKFRKKCWQWQGIADVGSDLTSVLNQALFKESFIVAPISYIGGVYALAEPRPPWMLLLNV